MVVSLAFNALCVAASLRSKWKERAVAVAPQKLAFPRFPSALSESPVPISLLYSLSPTSDFGDMATHFARLGGLIILALIV
jgi:hypothetical protein